MAQGKQFLRENVYGGRARMHPRGFGSQPGREGSGIERRDQTDAHTVIRELLTVVILFQRFPQQEKGAAYILLIQDVS